MRQLKSLCTKPNWNGLRDGKIVRKQRPGNFKRSGYTLKGHVAGNAVHIRVTPELADKYS